MNRYKLLSIAGITTIFTACNEQKNSPELFVNFDTSLLKNSYQSGEKIDLKVVAPENKTIDSVHFFLNEKKIASIKGANATSYTLENTKFGARILKSLSYIEGTAYESSLEIKILPKNAPEIWSYAIVNTYNHDQTAYTQGLEFLGGNLIESTGNGAGASGKKGKSSIRKVDPKTGNVLKIVELDDSIFGEGATVLNNKIYQLTYKNNEAIVYNAETLQKEKTIPYFKSMEGWGLTSDGTFLYMTDGTDKLYKINPADFSLVEEIYVATERGTVPTINELEWVNGKIYANFYGTDLIGVIEPTTGHVEAVIDFKELKANLNNHTDQDVFNGIAYNKATNTFFVTGKNWNKIFEVRINK